MDQHGQPPKLQTHRMHALPHAVHHCHVKTPVAPLPCDVLHLRVHPTVQLHQQPEGLLTRPGSASLHSSPPPDLVRMALRPVWTQICHLPRKSGDFKKRSQMVRRLLLLSSELGLSHVPMNGFQVMVKKTKTKRNAQVLFTKRRNGLCEVMTQRSSLK